MFVGHGLVAFAVAASVATERGWSADRAVTVGVIAALFGTLPDVDMAYALLGLFSGAEGLAAASGAFWDAADVVHRAVTHSLVVGLVGAAAFAALAVPDVRSYRLAAAALIAGLTGVVLVLSGPLGAVIVGLFFLAGAGITRVARSAGFGPRAVLWTALLGLLTHPFGDLLTGEPPRLLYPLDVSVFAGRITLHADPTLNLLGAFFLELSTFWLALLVVARLRGWSLRPLIRPRAALGVGYAGAVAFIPAPTLALSWPFVLSVLAVGVIGLPVAISTERGETRWQTLTTALSAITLAALAYTVAYLFV